MKGGFLYTTRNADFQSAKKQTSYAEKGISNRNADFQTAEKTNNTRLILPCWGNYNSAIRKILN
jgi:hypothetical protein